MIDNFIKKNNLFILLVEFFVRDVLRVNEYKLWIYKL